MAGKAWCCGPSGGGGGGLAAIAITDTPTVDLEGDGTPGAPLTATVRVHPFEPNGLTADPLGLMVRPSGDPGNALATGSDGHLFVPQAVDTTNVLGIAPGTPVGTDRSIDVDVTPGPVGTYTVGARLTPAWAQSALVGLPSIVPGTEAMIIELIVPEDGVYYMEAFVQGIANIVTQVPSAERYVIGRLKIDGVTQVSAHAMINQFTTADPESRFAISSVTIPLRKQLTAGQHIQAWALPFYDANNFADGFGALGMVGFNKISD
jgi:hypothetical protein